MATQQTLALALQNHRSGRRAEAEGLYRQALAADPSSHMAMFMLGALLMEVRKSGEAIDLLNKAIGLAPQVAEYRNALGTALLNTQQFAAAAAAFGKAVELRGTYADAHLGLGRALMALGQAEGALGAFNRAIELKAGFAAAYTELGNALRKQGRMDEALTAAARGAQFDPKSGWAWNILGLVHFDRGEYQQAAGSYARAVLLRPDLSEVHVNLAQLHRSAGQLIEAIGDLRKAVEKRGEDSAAWNNLGVVLAEVGAGEDAIQCHRKALQLRPNFPEAHSGLLLAMHYVNGYSPQRIFEEHVRWAAQHGSAERLPEMAREKKERLRIGYVSADLRQHPVAAFIEPILTAHDREKFEVFCYADIHRPDGVTGRLRNLVSAWRDIRGISNDAAARMIRQDGIDVLVDLGGHTERNRLLIFARRPAAVQMTYLGYPDTTGLSTMDYRLTDGNADPAGQSDLLYTEKLVRLASGFLCYGAAVDSPEVAEVPAKNRGGGITFGSFNNLAKVTPAVIGVWAKILGAIPSSRLMMKNRSLADGKVAGMVAEAFSKLGIDRGRLELRGPVASAGEHLAAYNEVDIALDTFPYNGTTTTCEALWMGVPVVTWTGHMHAARVGDSLLRQVGLAELIGGSEEEYIRIAVELAGNFGRLQELRRTMRERLRVSSLLDGKQMTREIEAAYMSAYEAWRTK